MLLGIGSAQTDEALFTEYEHYLHQVGHIATQKNQKRLLTSALTLRHQIDKPILAWTEEEILTAYSTRKRAFVYSCNVFLMFLFLRGYHRPSLQFLDQSGMIVTRQWTPVIEPYRKRLEQAATALGYAKQTRIGDVLVILLKLLLWCGKDLEMLSREDFERFRITYHSVYSQGRSDVCPDPRVYRLEQFLLFLKVIVPVQREFQYEHTFADLTHEPIKQALCFYMDWAKAKYCFSTLYSKKRALHLFVMWLQEYAPSVASLHEVTRPLAIAYAQHLAQQCAAQVFKQQYCSDIYNIVRHFFSFLIEEAFDERLQRNPFSLKDLPGKPDMIPLDV